MIEPELLLEAYRLGVFPMAMENGAIEWFSPEPRGILPLRGFHVPHALEKTLRKKIFEIRIDTRFSEVMERCAKRPDTWINSEILESYCHLHELGHAHSVEAWLEGKLVGGLYGVSLGGAFFGESMFHKVTDASKVALCALDRAFARQEICSARHAMAHAASVAIRRYRNSAQSIPAPARPRLAIIAHVLLETPSLSRVPISTSDIGR